MASLPDNNKTRECSASGGLPSRGSETNDAASAAVPGESPLSSWSVPSSLYAPSPEGEEVLAAFQNEMRIFLSRDKVVELCGDTTRLVVVDSRLPVHVAIQCLFEYRQCSATGRQSGGSQAAT
eukprot:GHVU01233222.1.p1 GENE.GHVU01233222.1~~GHVU01233222.1.p1  ORF type:complete len:123 (+),score=16.95 GHVU01233222.1:152-520(+)